jgi:hypothetical protein
MGQEAFNPGDIPFNSLPTMASNIVKDLMPDAKIHKVSLREGMYVSQIVGDSKKADIIMWPCRNGRRTGPKLLLLGPCGHYGQIHRPAQVCWQDIHAVWETRIRGETSQASLWPGQRRPYFSRSPTCRLAQCSNATSVLCWQIIFWWSSIYISLLS